MERLNFIIGDSILVASLITVLKWLYSINWNVFLPWSVHVFSDIRMILNDKIQYEKYEDFMVRRVLAVDPDTRWCPAPDCR
jgi:hypothetical protein